MKAVIDADVLCFQSSTYGADQRPQVQWDDDGSTSNMGWTGRTLEIVDHKIKEWCELAQCDDNPIMVFSDLGGANFRKEFCPHYKGNRTTDKPSDYMIAVSYIQSKYTWYSFPRLEGDDVQGLLISGPKRKEFVGVTTDKDIYTVPGNILRIGDHDEPWHNTEEDANRYWMGQTLTGDTVDNYKGCPGAGKKRVAKELDEVRSLNEMWRRVLHVYAEMHDHDRWGKMFTQSTAYDEALMNARCARILRYGDWSKKTGDITLWTP